MHISDAIAKLKKELPDIETSVLADATNENEKNDLRSRFQKLYDCLNDKSSMAIHRRLLHLSMWYKNKTNEKNFTKPCRISELAGMFIRVYRKPVIFLSHSSKDKKYADPLRTFISKLGVPDDQIIYTSHHKHNIPLDENIYDYLAKRIHENSLMINLWSNNYFESLACICETGAAWVSGCAHVNLCIPPLSFSDERFNAMPIGHQKMGVVLDGSSICKKGMMELSQKIKQFSRISDDQHMGPILNEFMVEINKVEAERCNES